MMQVYLDNSAASPQSGIVTETVIDAMENCFGNPSSLHSLGVRAEKLLKSARKKAADAICAASEEIIFTSGGTESDNMAIFGAAEKMKHSGDHIITTEIEHPAVMECFKHLQNKGYRVTYIRSDKNGIIDIDMLNDSVTENTALVSVMHVNNETGAIQPVKQVYEIVKNKSRALFHCDAVQSFGKLPPENFKNTADLLSASAHKIHGPKGAGLLFIRRGLQIPALMRGGGQERGLRSGTENIPAIAGFGAAAEEAAKSAHGNLKYVASLRKRLLSELRKNIGDIKLNGPENAESDADMNCIPHILNITFEGTRGEVLLHMLEQSGVYVSTGAACSSRKKGYSHVLKAMGRSAKEAEGALRFSLSPYNTPEEIDYAAEMVKKAVAANRSVMKR